MWEDLTKIEICEKNWWIIEILCFWYPSPMKQVEKFEIKNKYVLMNDENNFLIYPYLHREYYLFSQNSESSLEQ